MIFEPYQLIIIICCFYCIFPIIIILFSIYFVPKRTFKLEYLEMLNISSKSDYNISTNIV